jgi:hypothetical protein
MPRVATQYRTGNVKRFSTWYGSRMKKYTSSNSLEDLLRCQLSTLLNGLRFDHIKDYDFVEKYVNELVENRSYEGDIAEMCGRILNLISVRREEEKRSENFNKWLSSIE